MAFKLDRKEMLRLARIGAEARLEALELERQAILAGPGGVNGRAALATNN